MMMMMMMVGMTMIKPPHPLQQRAAAAEPFAIYRSSRLGDFALFCVPCAVLGSKIEERAQTNYSTLQQQQQQ